MVEHWRRAVDYMPTQWGRVCNGNCPNSASLPGPLRVMHIPKLNLRAGRLLHFSAAVLAIIWTLHGPPDATLTSDLRLTAFCYLVIIAPQPGLNLVIVLPLIIAYEPFGLGCWLGLFMYTPLFWAIYTGRMFSSVQVAAFITFGQVFVITPWIEPFLRYTQMLCMG